MRANEPHLSAVKDRYPPIRLSAPAHQTGFGKFGGGLTLLCPRRANHPGSIQSICTRSVSRTRPHSPDGVDIEGIRSIPPASDSGGMCMHAASRPFRIHKAWVPNANTQKRRRNGYAENSTAALNEAGEPVRKAKQELVVDRYIRRWVVQDLCQCENMNFQKG